ncbi:MULTISPECIES: uridine diphosphate-N-acetylglucosamine-binding protein YvcK [unclassified Amycolatopsis]|uniref:gluconeogenesis factor YvcK family protein n=1 Tax=unclassified Amycolatopsis TaxID=2618356 RepID=UPI002875121C|nr:MULTISPECIES: uridine diphosphate-N-acetylglucosamine-binding protein YvcK [unclassified Amycolatopsis]MDS0138620.1 uridine diphosphate-N-acetylglucosamine-binding protein YvcK [Amycolatopsis sp. 505]MDS0146103.1 uridine diphosphate-N-acetylglucosamine-binding protein YvcK [Amycolatopsis sp. CM201R]
MRAVALGGGHGLHATLSAVRRVTPDVTAVVTVADDGGSSGRLRRELGLLPPGDLRQAFAAFAAEDGGTLWAEVFQHRFGGDGALAGHAVGNLLLAGLFEVLGDPVAALDEACRLMGVSGRVLPMSPEPLEIEGQVSGLDSEDPAALRTIRGQVAVATTPGQVRRVSLRSPGRAGRPPLACEEAVQAVLNADVVFLGPGSWFTSVLPHLLVPGLRDALVRTAATKVLVLNLVPQPGETAGFSPERHLDVLFEHAPDLRVDAVIADRDSVPDPANLRRAAERLGGRAHLGAVGDPEVLGRHDPDALALCMREALGLGGEHGGGAKGREGQ